MRRRSLFGQVDTNRLATLGKDGCYTSRGFVNSNSQTAGVIIKSLSEMAEKEKKERINGLSLGLASKAKEIRELSAKSQNNYQKYIDTPIPVCGAGVTGWLAKAVGTGGYQKCLAAVDKLRDPVMLANTQFIEMANRVKDLNADYSELMQYAPSTLDWQKLCQSKIDLDNTHKQLREANAKLGEAALKKLNSETTLQEKADNEFSKFEQMMQLFLNALEAMIKMVMAVFESFLRGLTKFSAFIADHPMVLWAGAGVVGLGVIAFVLRPYVSLLSLAVGRKC